MYLSNLLIHVRGSPFHSLYLQLILTISTLERRLNEIIRFYFYITLRFYLSFHEVLLLNTEIFLNQNLIYRIFSVRKFIICGGLEWTTRHTPLEVDLELCSRGIGRGLILSTEMVLRS